MSSKTIFTDKVRVLHITPLKCTAYGNPMRNYIFQRVNTIEQIDALDTFEAKNEPNSYNLVNLNKGDIVELQYRRRGKSWDFVAISYREVE